MHRKRQFGKQPADRGAALLIAIFALLLVSVVAIALIVSSGTDTALASNYRSSANAYYAALAGIEEARGRLLPTDANFIPLPGNPMPLTQVVYILNPADGTVVPDNLGNPATYPDNEYTQEFGVPVTSRVITKIASVSPAAGLPGPNYKWVRINAVTEKTLGDGTNGVDVNWDGTVDSVTPLFYDPANLNGGNPSPGLVENAAPPPTAGQALEITSYAVLPSGTQKMLQYVVRPLVVFPSLNAPLFPAALTLAGNSVTFTAPGTASFFIKGQDPGAVPDPTRQDQCPGSTLAMPAIGYTNNSKSDPSLSNINAAATPAGNYQGAPITPGPPPVPATAASSPSSIAYVGAPQLNPNWLTPIGLDAVVQDITQSADAVINGSTTPASFPSGMSPTHPMTIVVNGDLDLNGWHNTGYGLLLVTGTLKYDPDASWQGVVLLIGQGSFVSTKGGAGQIDGAMFIAKTRDASNNLLATLGAASFSQTGGGPNLGTGINFNSCIAQAAEGPLTYKILSFKEIALPN